MNAMSPRRSLVLALALVALSLTLALAGRAGLFGADAATRSSMILTGLILAYYGNDIPKTVLRSAAALRAHRIAGWSFALGGVLTVVLWAFAPLDLALAGTLCAVGLAVGVTVGACALGRAGARTPST